MAISPKTMGFAMTPDKTKLGIYYRGTLVGTANATDFGMVGAGASTSLTSTTGITAGTSVDAGTSLSATTTITAGTGVIVSTGNATNTAGDSRITAGNLRLGAISTFAATEPTSAVVMKEGTNPVGAITTSGGVFVTTGGATISKIIADGTVSQVEA